MSFFFVYEAMLKSVVWPDIRFIAEVNTRAFPIFAIKQIIIEIKKSVLLCHLFIIIMLYSLVMYYMLFRKEGQRWESPASWCGSRHSLAQIIFPM